MAATRLSAGKIVKHLIAKNGPMTTQKLFEFVPTYPQQFVSKTHLKQKILKSLEGEGVLYKQVHRETAASKPNWQWQFRNAENVEKYKNAL
ncbi:hypothetical protein PS15m_001492 [Mucor circinelloides]|uniref:H15 domain-containing protein n=1 Tax=Mucor circinelloides f. circinelloides (strain 1006PhL) TaxID=1220926 RepID=S2JLZ7_MUCC1|nr:hypothetical protein HMPREF1544_03611 [Mucor circinelloides 1006PhL]KAG1092894.1 hypothetical protein G6F42_019087 [Rhizopus arrhizus]